MNAIASPTLQPLAWPASAAAPLIDFDAAAFDPWRIMPVTHRLSAHPLLQTDALLALGERLEARGSIRSHSNAAKPGTPFNSAQELFPNPRSAVDTLREVAAANAWTSLLNVQLDPAYRVLVGEVLEGIRPAVEARDPGMCHRGGWIFVTSPNTVTPFHFDREHNFILQVHGRKRIYVWDHRDTEVASEHARDLFHLSNERYLLRWRESFRERARVFDLEPGQGAYMPSTSPHMVENGDGPSITASFTYYTDGTRRDALLHRAHARLRRARISPPPVAPDSAFDRAAYLVSRLLGAGTRASAFAEVPGP